ncbi:MarR family winged helix-turn-helix transcriptional regulator [Streptomyces sp. NPDC091259]|uniref:MarR family winged helix-turn-helix transcriptional regulator n=1 Tax=Streptomyces sp. NPDC091259 TaxID=3365976 RepID=UPI0037FEFE01
MDRAGPSEVPADDASREVAEAAEALVDCWTRAGRDIPPGLSALQVRALIAVRRCPGVNLSRLAEQVGASVPAASRLCDRLEAAGLLRRFRAFADRREVGLSLTARGDEALTSLAARRAADLCEVLSWMAVEDRRSLVTGLLAFTRAVDAGAPGHRRLGGAD